MKDSTLNKLVEIAKKRFEESENQLVHFTGVEKIDLFLNDLNNYPFAFVLACLMDRQIKAERAWKIPYQVCEITGTKSILDLSYISENEYINIFEQNNLHRFNKVMAKNFHKAVLRIRNVYNLDASKIWLGNPSSSSVVYRFMEFNGSGIKISTMAANILARQFKIPFSDYYSVDISPDVHIIKVMKRIGYVDSNANNDMIIYKARELNPEFPGIIDFSCWEIGRKWCKSNKPDCLNCIVNSDCMTYKTKNK